MDNLADKTVIVTGAASGIGEAMVRRFADVGMNVVLVDVEEPPVRAVAADLKSRGVPHAVLVGDVSREDTSRSMVELAIERFGGLHVVCLNAGVGSSGSLATGDLAIADWEWTLGVNLWGVIYGLQHAVPHLLAQDDGHIVVTSSICGHTALKGLSAYNASKHAVAAISETLWVELQEQGSHVGVSCLCPSLVNTKIIHSERNRPEQATMRPPTEPSDDDLQRRAMRDEIFAAALAPSVVAELVERAIIDKQFWIFTDHAFDELIALRHRHIEARENPVLGGNLVEESMRSQTQ